MINREFELWKDNIRQEGIQLGIQQGIQQRDQQIARALATLHMSAEQIVRVTGLSQADVQGILAASPSNTACPAN